MRKSNFMKTPPNTAYYTVLRYLANVRTPSDEGNPGVPFYVTGSRRVKPARFNEILWAKALKRISMRPPVLQKAGYED